MTRRTFAIALIASVIALSPASTFAPAALAAAKKAKNNKKKPANNKKKPPAKKGGLRFAKEDWRQVANPIFAAVYDNDVSKVVAILKKDKKSVNAVLVGKYSDASKFKGLIGGSPLLFASWKGRDRIAALLIRAGAKVDATDSAGMTSLHWAAQYRFHKIVAQLIKAGADPKAKDKTGKTPSDLTADDKIKAYLKKAAESKA